MATEEQQNDPTGDTSGQGIDGQQQSPAGDMPGNGDQQQATTPAAKDIVLPDDHPIVKQMRDDKAKLASVRQELTEARAQSSKAAQLQAELDKRPTQEALTTLQTRYDRLEAFLQQAGGDLGSALDSRSFTRQLFESEDKVEDIVKAWHKAHPSATSQALGGKTAGAVDGSGKQDPNELIRAAWNGGAK